MSNIKTDTEVCDFTKMEEELRNNNSIFVKKISSQVPGMLYLFRMKTDGTFSVPFTTDAIKDIFGCSPEDVRNDFSSITKVILPDDRERVINSIKDSASNLSLWECEYRVQIPGQPVRWMHGQSMPDKLPNGDIVWYGFNTEITKSKKLEQELHNTIEELETMNKAMVGRENRMIELKEEIESLKKQLEAQGIQYPH
jgi:hypothetical protein